MTLALKIGWYLLALCLILNGCKENKRRKKDAKTPPKKELMVYCENTMLNLVNDIKGNFEEKYNCKVTIKHDCAKNLMGMIKYSSRGDLYIPASSYSFKDFEVNTGFQLTDSVFIAYNHLVYMVRKGNAIKFDGKLNRLKKKGELAVLIANPETSSLGIETRRFLKKQNAYEQVLQNVVALTLDAKGLVKGLNNNEADVVFNWESNIRVNGNSEDVDVIEVDPVLQYMTTVPVYMASLSCSNQPELSRAFLDFAIENANNEYLQEFGFTKRQTIIF